MPEDPALGHVDSSRSVCVQIVGSAGTIARPADLSIEARAFRENAKVPGGSVAAIVRVEQNRQSPFQTPLFDLAFETERRGAMPRGTTGAWQYCFRATVVCRQKPQKYPEKHAGKWRHSRSLSCRGHEGRSTFSMSSVSELVIVKEK